MYAHVNRGLLIQECSVATEVADRFLAFCERLTAVLKAEA